MKEGEKMFELVIVWAFPKETVVYEYETESEARRAERGMQMANGNQIEWSCVRQKY